MDYMFCADRSSYDQISAKSPAFKLPALGYLQLSQAPWGHVFLMTSTYINRNAHHGQ